MSVIEAPEISCKADSEARNFAVDFRGRLDVGELVTGTPTAVEISTSDLTITNVGVSTVPLTINGQIVAIGKAVQLHVAVGGTVGTIYRVLLTGPTDSTPAQTLKAIVRIKVVGDV